MSKSKIDEDLPIFSRLIRQAVSVPCRTIDKSVEVVQGKSDSVRKLYEDYVLGRLDPSQIGSKPVYDPDGSDEVDPFNNFGVTLEEASELEMRGREAAAEVRKRSVPKAKAPEQKEPAQPKEEEIKEDE